MANLPVITIDPAKHRTYGPLLDILRFYAILFIATKAKVSASTPGWLMEFKGQASQVRILCDLELLASHFVDGMAPNFIYLAYDAVLPDIQGQMIESTKSLSEHIATAIFSMFSEKCIDWVKVHVTTDYHKFPPVSNFARVVRNAFVHGGTVNISSPNAPTVSWKGLQYGPAHNGLPIFNTGTDLCLCDLLILMIELDEEMTSLGAPINLG